MISDNELTLRARAIAGQLALETMHEIRNPLEALNNLLYLSVRNAAHPKIAMDYVLLAQEQMGTLIELSTPSLPFSNPAKSHRSICLVALAEAAVRVHKRKIMGNRINLVKDFPDGLLIQANRGELLQVVSNLVANALDALPQEGTIRMRLRRGQDRAHIVIADSGQGIPKPDLATIFTPFYSTKGEHGTGLGLAISKRIVEQHNGKIQVRSSVASGNCGTTFRISLPA
jgi:signal transduction histidine kinase